MDLQCVDGDGELAGLNSDDVLRELAPGLEQLGYAVEASRIEADRIRCPVLFGGNGRAEVSYDIDAFHDELGIVPRVALASCLPLQQPRPACVGGRLHPGS